MLAKSTKSFLIGAGLAGGIAVVALGAGLMVRGGQPTGSNNVATASSLSPAGGTSIDPCSGGACSEPCTSEKKSACSTKATTKSKSACASGCSH